MRWVIILIYVNHVFNLIWDKQIFFLFRNFRRSLLKTRCGIVINQYCSNQLMPYIFVIIARAHNPTYVLFLRVLLYCIINNMLNLRDEFYYFKNQIRIEGHTQHIHIHTSYDIQIDHSFSRNAIVVGHNNYCRNPPR